MKIGIRADGSKKIGMGHLTRCSALAMELQKRGHETTFVTLQGTSGWSWLQDNGFSTIGVISGNSDEECAFVSQWCRTNNVAALIVDSYSVTSEYLACLKENSIQVVVIDDDHRFSYDCSMLINGNFSADISDYSDCKSKRMLVGPQYAILRKEFNREAAPLRDQIHNVLVTLGGSDPNSYTPVVLDGLKDFERITIKVVIGPLMNNEEEIKKAGKKCKGKVQLLKNPESMADLMLNCDIAITAGGGTIKELFAMGVVSVVILQADNQNRLGKKLASIGYDLCLGSYKDVDPDRIKNVVGRLISNPGLREAYRNKFVGIVAMNGTARIVDELLCMIDRKRGN